MALRLPWLGRPNREACQRGGEQSRWQRAAAEVERRLATYTPVATDPQAVAEMERIIHSEIQHDAPLWWIAGRFARVGCWVCAKLTRGRQ